MTIAPPPSGPPVADRTTVARDHTRFAARDRDRLVTTALRTRSAHAREILAELAHPGSSPEELLARLAASDGVLDDGTDGDALARFAMVVGLQRGLPHGVRDALAVADLLEASAHLDDIPPRALETLGQLRLVHDDVEGGLRMLEHPAVRPTVLAAARADALNPALGCDSDDEVAWAEAFTAALGRDTAPVALRPGPAPSPFDRLSASAPAVHGTTRVSVLMSTYRPRRTDLLTAVRGVLDQTWRNLELLVVDDMSGPELTELLDEVASLDPRVRVIRKAVNGGTYRARNTAMRVMTGDLFTVVDSDDWVHPQMVEAAVRHLEQNPGRVAVRSQGVRVTEDLRLTRPGYAHRYPSAASLMVPVHPTLARVGFFDPTRKGADTEYARRVEAAFGQQVPTLPLVMTFNRTLPGSLSAEEFSRGWRHGARHEYKSVYAAWHQGIRSGAESPWLDPAARRTFPQPLRWNTRPDAGPRRLDVVFGGDWRRFGGPQRSMLEEIRACLEGGLRVGVLHLEALRFMSTDDPPLCGPLVDLLRRGTVTQVQVDDPVEVGLLLVRYPPILQYPPTASGALRPSRVVVVANQAPLEADGSDQRYVVRDVTERTEELFGTRPLWWPQGPTVRELLVGQDPTAELLPRDDLGLIDVEHWHVRPHHDPAADGRPLVVGRYSRDDVIKFPQTFAEVRAAYDLGPGHRVRFMGARSQLRRLAEEAGTRPEDFPAEWEVLAHRAVDTREFLAGLDVFVYMDNPSAHEAFGRVLLEAAASGVLTIAHPKHEPTFGPILDYALPHEVPALLERYRDPGLYHDRVRRTLDGVRAAFGHERFLSDVRELLPPPGLPAGIDPEPLLHTPPWLALPEELTGRRVLSSAVRSFADGERADGVALVLDDDADAARVAAWLLASIRDTAEADLDDQLAAGAGELGVLAVLTHRDGMLLPATAARPVGAPVQQSVDTREARA